MHTFCSVNKFQLKGSWCPDVFFKFPLLINENSSPIPLDLKPVFGCYGTTDL